MKIRILENGEVRKEIDAKNEIEQFVSDAEIIIGRDPGCLVQLDSFLVSREHAKLIRQKNQWLLESLTGFGELKLNHQDVKQAVVKDGDLITIGPYNLSIELNNEESPRPAVVTKKIEVPDDLPSVELQTHTVALGSVKDLDQDTDPEIELKDDELPELDMGGDDALDTFEEEVLPVTHEEGPLFEEGPVEVENVTPEPQGDFAFPEEDSFGDSSDQFGVEAYKDDSGGTAVISGFSEYTLEVFGEFAPYDNYKVTPGEHVIGRDAQKCQILLKDPEVSATHAVVKVVKGQCFLEDLNSANGTILNGKRVNTAELGQNDEFVIGSTTFTVKVQSQLIKEQNVNLMPVEENQEIEVEEIVEVDAEGEEEFEEEVVKNNSLFSKEALKDPKKRMRLIIIGLGVFLLFLVLSDDEKTAPKPANKNKATKTVEQKPKKNLSPEQEAQLENIFILANNLAESGKYAEAILEYEKIFEITENYKEARTRYEETKRAWNQLKEEEEKRKKEEERLAKEAKVNSLIEQARTAVKEKNIPLADALFSQIFQIDPENLDVTPLKMEIDAWKQEEENKRLAEERKKAIRKAQEEKFSIPKNLYVQEKWFEAISEFEKFLVEKDIDSDLIESGTKMLEESRKKLEEQIGPLLGKAKSYKEGQDLKNAYESFKEILKYYPTHVEALNEMDEIETTLEVRARKIFREGLVAESLSLFDTAREKFQEVQQISPTNSEYYIRATEKLNQYTD